MTTASRTVSWPPAPVARSCGRRGSPRGASPTWGMTGTATSRSANKCWRRAVTFCLSVCPVPPRPLRVVCQLRAQRHLPEPGPTRWTGTKRLTDTYRYCHHLPLRDSDDALHVDWCELTTTDATGRELFRSAWAASHIVTTETVGAIVRRAAAAGKSRMKSTIRSRRRSTTSSIIWPWQAASVRTTGDPDPFGLPGAHHPPPPGPTLSGRARPVTLTPDLLRTLQGVRSVSPLRILGPPV